MNLRTIRTRFAPSPTGYLHIGSLRTLLYAYLTSKSQGGDFLLRIEDTDRTRLVEDSVSSIFMDLQWLNLDLDEGPSSEELQTAQYSFETIPQMKNHFGPYIQSLKKARYKEVAEELIRKGIAYRCDCSAEKLEEERRNQIANHHPPGYSGYCRHRGVTDDKPHVVRLKIPEGKSVLLSDLVRGPISWTPVILKDTVILKTDGMPTYHLASVVDDFDMQITHVIRGDEWISTAPLHLMIYEAMGWLPPLFAHLPAVLGADGKKLSKRHGATEIRVFREKGYLPEALLNFILHYGWAPGKGSNEEFFSLDQMKKVFDLSRVHSAGGIFSYEKLDWMNGVYIRNLTTNEFISRATEFIQGTNPSWDSTILDSILPHVQERISKLSEITEMIQFLFVQTLESREMDYIKLENDVSKKLLSKTHHELSMLEAYSLDSINDTLDRISSEAITSKKNYLILLRIAVTGKKATPPLVESMFSLGKDKTLIRLEETLDILNG